MPKLKTITHSGTAQIFTGRVGIPSNPEKRAREAAEAERLAREIEEPTPEPTVPEPTEG